jgi:hypothetical protein
MAITSEAQLQNVLQRIGIDLQDVQNYLGDTCRKDAKFRFPRGFIRRAADLRKRFGFLATTRSRAISAISLSFPMSFAGFSTALTSRARRRRCSSRKESASSGRNVRPYSGCTAAIARLRRKAFQAASNFLSPHLFSTPRLLKSSTGSGKHVLLYTSIWSSSASTRFTKFLITIELETHIERLGAQSVNMNSSDANQTPNQAMQRTAR